MSSFSILLIMLDCSSFLNLLTVLDCRSLLNLLIVFDRNYSCFLLLLDLSITLDKSCRTVAFLNSSNAFNRCCRNGSDFLFTCTLLIALACSSILNMS